MSSVTVAPSSGAMAKRCTSKAFQDDDDDAEPLARSKTTWASTSLPAHGVRGILEAFGSETELLTEERKEVKKKHLAWMVKHISGLEGQSDLIFDGSASSPEDTRGMYLSDLAQLLPQDGSTESPGGSTLERQLSAALYFHFVARWRPATVLSTQKAELGTAREWSEKDRPVCNLAMPKAVMEGTECGPIGVPGHYINGARIPPLVAATPALPSYVATQHPLPSTVGDFWWTVLERRPACIVMLNEHDYDRGSGDQACAEYWLPSAISSDSGLMLEELDCQTGPEGVVVRTLRVSLGGEVRDRTALPACPSHTVRHVSLSWWPDMEAPALDRFVTSWRVFQALLSQASAASQGAPEIFVHCAGGIGRTGVFIAADMSARAAVCQTEGQVNRLSCLSHVEPHQAVVSPDIAVGHLRSCRVNMVQSAAQYFFLHYVHNHLVAHLKSSPAPPLQWAPSCNQSAPGLSRSHSA